MNEEQQQQVAQLESLFRQHATKEALVRYGNLKVAHPKKTLQVLVVFAKMIEEGRVQEITDDTLKAVLIKLDQPKSFNIQRK